MTADTEAARVADLHSLAARAEAADPSEQRQWLEQAFYAINPRPERYVAACQRPGETDEYPIALGERIKDWMALSFQFTRMLDAEAYESAAMMLVPEGWQVAALEQNWRTGLWRAQLIPVPSATLIAAFDRGETVGWNTADAPDSGTGGIVTPALALAAACLKARATQGDAA
jgi:hypothetical protein